MASSEASTEDDADYELKKKHLYLPSGKRIKLKSPRFLAALAENGVVLAELEVRCHPMIRLSRTND